MSNITLLKNNNQLEDSMLRSVLLFNSQKETNSNKDLMLKAILSIITNGNGRYGLDEISNILKERFKIIFSKEDLNRQINKLKSKGLVTDCSNNMFQAATNEKQGNEFFQRIEEETNALIDGILNRVKSKSGIIFSQSNEMRMKENILCALSVYYKMYGYSFFGLKENSKQKETLDAVCVARKGLPDNLGKALVGAMADVIDEPTLQEKNILEKWARAFVAMEVINLDPSLRNFKATKLREKSFVIDTDVALNALTTHAKYSVVYREMINLLRRAGCKLYVPHIVVEEIQSHIDAANKRYIFEGSQWLSMTDEILENKIANVFVEDYVKIVKNNKEREDFPFDIYLENFSDPENPSLLMTKLKEVFGEDFIPMKDLESLDNDIKIKLANRIKDLTKISAKGIRRDEEKNTQIAEADASLYLTIRRMNCDCNGNDKPLSQKAYLLTKSQKTITCAQELEIYDKNIICDPFALLSILQEMGMFAGHEFEIVNLFENPFLAYTANLIWDEVKPLLEKGAKLKYKEIHRLRIDVDAKIDKILTCETLEERTAEAKRLIERGYLFANDLLSIQQEIEKRDKDIQERDEQLAKQREEIKSLRDKLNTDKKETKKLQYMERAGIISKKKKKKK